MKVLKEFYNFVMDEGTGMIREDDIIAFEESKCNSIEIDLSDVINMSKSDMNAAVSDKLELLSDGWIDEESLFVYAKKLESVAEILVNAVKDKVDSSKFGASYVKFGVKLESKMVGVKTDYSGCGYLPYDESAGNLSSAKLEIKKQEDFLKALKSPLTLLDEKTGEVSIINPPVKSGKLSPIATIL